MPMDRRMTNRRRRPAVRTLSLAALLLLGAGSSPAAAARPSGGGGVRTVSFSGYTWLVKASRGRVGPGPNYFSSDTQNVWIDGQGLHLAITNRKGKWYCAEVLLDHSLGYGTYVFSVGSRADLYDPNVVVGLFTWSNDAAYNHREIDIEFSRWADPNNQNAQDVVQPYSTAGNIHRFQMNLTSSDSTHTFDWATSSIAFRSAQGLTLNPAPSDVIDQWTYSGSDIPLEGNEVPHINLWLFRGNAPTDGQSLELVITQFQFVPAA
jgi:hypothetical protein